MADSGPVGGSVTLHLSVNGSDDRFDCTAHDEHSAAGIADGSGGQFLRADLHTIPSRALTILCATELNEWRRGWGPAVPSKEAIISIGDTARGTLGTATAVTPIPNLSYTLLGEPETVEPLIEAIETYLRDVGPESPIVLIDDVSELVATYDSTMVGRLLDRLTSMTDAIGSRVAIGCRAGAILRNELDTVFRAVDEVYGVSASVIASVDRLEGDDPTTMGYLRRHWREALYGIEQCDRNYPQAKQIHAILDNPQTTTRTLGATLSGMVGLGVLETWGETVGATRYDLTAYDPWNGLCAGIALEATAAAVHVVPRC